VGSVSHVQVCTAPHACRAPKPQLRPQATSMAEEDIWVTKTHDSLSRSPARLSPHTAAPTGRPSSIPPHATCVIVFRLHHEETASRASFQDIQQDHVVPHVDTHPLPPKPLTSSMAAISLEFLIDGMECTLYSVRVPPCPERLRPAPRPSP